MTNLAIWDFDGTLSERSQWSRILHEVLLQQAPHLSITVDEVRPRLASGFPWHDAERAHPELNDPVAWWTAVEGLLNRVLRSFGQSDSEAVAGAREVHRLYVQPDRFLLHDDALTTLEALRERGWRQVILTNHVPEFRAIADALDLSSRVDAIVNSAETGVEKPKSEAFELARAAAGPHDRAWMLGDSYLADVEGAERAGIPGILVRTEDSRAQHRVATLADAVGLLDQLAAEHSHTARR